MTSSAFGRNFLTATLVWFAVAATGQGVFAADLFWKPQKTWVFVAGVLEFQDKKLGSWSSHNRRDSQFVDFFRTQGVPQDHITYLKDKSATLANLERGLKSLLAKTSPGDFLFFYYTGHGEQDNSGGYFANYDANDDKWWDINDVVKTVNKEFKGSRVFMAADCCTSGCLAQAAKKQKGTISYAVITSSAPGQTGHGNWTFSQSLLDGIRGEPFVDSDGKQVSLANLAAYAKRESSTFEDENCSFVTTGSFSPQDIIADLTGPVRPAPQPVQVLYEKKWWKGKLMETRDGKARIHWVQLGYDAADDEEWVDVNTVRALK